MTVRLVRTALHLTLLAVCAGCVPDYAPASLLTQPARDAASAHPGPSGEQPDAGQPIEVDHGLGGPEDDAGAGDADVATLGGPSTQKTLAPCDLTGSWLIVEREVTSALGARQVSHNFFYVEITQQGEAASFSKSLGCGDTTIGLQPVIISQDSSRVWPSYLTHQSYGGRKGTSTKTDQGCEIAFEKMAVVHGATTSEYTNIAIALPDIDHKADGSTPGWEDWDADGNPGVTYRVSGSITGSVYTATRTWTQYQGTVSSTDSAFTLPLIWDQSRTNLGYDGSPLLGANANRDGDATQHMVGFARLSAAQIAGDDAAKCAAVRMLASTLTPDASQ